MPRSRVTESPQKPSPRGTPQSRTSSSNSDPLNHRPRIDRSPKSTESQSPRSVQSEPVNRKKLGTRVTNLESQLGKAVEELKSLKHQLASSEADQKTEPKTRQKETSSDDVEKETDVFEVPIEKETVENKPESENPSFDDLRILNDEMNSLKMQLDEKGRELEAFLEENERLKNEVNEKSVELSSAQSEVQELALKLNKVDQELEESKICVQDINEKLEAAEKEKEELENEMKRIRVQTEQWKKAADAAASVLAGEVDVINGRCGSMDKHYVNGFDPIGAYVGSPGMMDDPDDVKRKAAGGRAFGDLWKKKGQK